MAVMNATQGENDDENWIIILKYKVKSKKFAEN